MNRLAPTSRRRFLAAGGALAAGAFLLPRPLHARQAAATAAARVPMGMNLAGIADWEAGFPFKNMLWGARPWLTRNSAGDGPWDTGHLGLLPLDPDGYPLELPATLPGVDAPQHVMTLIANQRPGLYVILHDGEGELAGDLGLRITASAPGRLEAEIGSAQYAVIVIRRSTRGNHVRNLRIVPAEFENDDLRANPFLPEFVEFCRPFHALRFMDWQSTNNALNTRWDDRRTTTFYTQTGFNGDPFGFWGAPVPDWQRRWGSGVSIDLCIQICNTVRADAWLCVPHLADDACIEAMARHVKARLDPRLRVYVEFSNEIWNWQFQQAGWMLRSKLAGDLCAAAGRNVWEGTPEFIADGSVASGGGKDHPERIGALFRRCFAIWERVFDGDDRRRLVRVAAVQAGWFDTAQRTLRWCLEHGGCDALSPAGYFGPDDAVYERWAAAGAALTADQVVDDMAAVIEASAEDIAAYGRLARDSGVALINYEAGQHIQPKGQAELPYNPALGAAQSHPRMYDLYLRNIALWREAGCSLFGAFSSVGRQGTRWGSWGHLARYDQPLAEAPKMRALLDANTPRA